MVLTQHIVGDSPLFSGFTIRRRLGHSIILILARDVIIFGYGQNIVALRMRYMKITKTAVTCVSRVSLTFKH